MAHAVSKAKSDVAGGGDRSASADPRRPGHARQAARASRWSTSRRAISQRSAPRIRSRWCCNIPARTGAMRDLSEEIAAAHEAGALAIVAADLLALALLTPPGEMGADIVVGSAQRFGVPMGFGGPHAGFFATQGRVQARTCPAAWSACRVDAAGAAGDAPGAANARAAHPPREGDLQHLHRAGAAGRDRRVLRRLARAGGAASHRAAREPAGAHAGRCRATRRAAAARTRRSSTRSRLRRRRRCADRARARQRASICGGSTTTGVAIALDETVTRDDLQRAGRGCWVRRCRAPSPSHPGGPAARHAVPAAVRLQPASRRTRDAALSQAAGRQGHRAEPQHDPARFLHDEAERHGRDDPDHAARASPTCIRSRRRSRPRAI